MSAQDYRINAEVRRLLVSRWIDVSRLQIGTTNGVVYLMGVMEPSVDDALERAGQRAETRDPGERLIRLMVLVEKELRRVRGVRDLVVKLRNVQKKGRTWRIVGAAGGSDGAGGASRAVRPPTPARQEISEEPEIERREDAETPRRA